MPTSTTTKLVQTYEYVVQLFCPMCKHTWIPKKGVIPKVCSKCKRIIDTPEAKYDRKVIPTAVKKRLLAQGACTKCGSTSRLEIDHIVSLAAGGTNAEANLQLLCLRCNRAKAK